METINNVANAAAKAMMGEGSAGKEPVSGAKGDVNRGEPYDAGNLETPGQMQVEKRLETAESNEKSNDTISATTHTPNSGSLERGDVDEHSNNETLAPKIEESDPPTPEGPGPRPLTELAKEHNGDAGRLDDQVSKTKSDGASDESSEEKNKGTGQEYVKSTGFAAEGGDFDATKPGAGKEAERLFGHGTHTDSGSPDENSSKNKPSLGERIKAKLHKH